jgi:endonuclease/exonuclease/phosphatase (EEP) superfamily protein YafD
MAGTASRQAKGRAPRALRRVAAACAIGYPCALAAIVLAFRFIGERWWVTLAAMYLPRLGFALPLPFVIAAAWFWGSRRLIALQAVSVALLVFPLMGFNPGVGRMTARATDPALRVMSFNVSFGRPGAAAVLQQVRAFAADVVVLQDAGARFESDLRKAFSGWNARLDGEFFLATRYVIRDAYVPPDLEYPKGKGGAHFVQYTLETPVGLVDLFNVHPTTPRPGLEEVRGNGLGEELVSGRLLTGKAGGTVEWNAYRRTRQVAGIAARANASPKPVIIAGDTNLPGLSRTLAEHLGRYRDAFHDAGAGFGYTFPARRPWMRIDRILTGDRLKAVEFRVGDATRSDHRSVFALIGAMR